MSDMPQLRDMSERELLLLACERLNTVDARLTSQHGKIEKQEGRLDSLETWRTFLAGAWCVISFLGVMAAKTLWAKLTGGH